MKFLRWVVNFLSQRRLLSVKEGDKFKDTNTGKVYRVKGMNSERIILELEDGSDRILLDRDLSKPIIPTLFVFPHSFQVA